MRKSSAVLIGLTVASAAFVLALAYARRAPPDNPIIQHQVWEDPPVMRELCSVQGERAIMYTSHGRTTITPTGESCAISQTAP